MSNWLDDWNEQVQKTSPITTSVWSVYVALSISVIEGAEPIEAIVAFSRRLSEVLNGDTVGASFISGFSHEEWRYEKQTSGSIYIWPVRFSIVAENVDQALRRLKAFGKFLNHIADQDKWLPRIQLEEQLATTSFAQETKTFEPADLVTNYPLHSNWSDSGLDTIDHEVAIHQFAQMMEVRSLEIRTSTVLEAKRSLEALVNLLPLVEIDVYNWKWVVIATHNSLQNFMIAALEGTSPVNVLYTSEPSTSGKESSRNAYPALLGFSELYSRVKNDRYMMQNMYSKRYEHQGNVGNSVKRLNRLRNDFVHFDPKTLILDYYSIFTLPRTLEDALNLIRFLAFESHNVRWHIYPIERIEAKLLLAEVRTILNGIAENYWTVNNRLGLGLKAEQIRLGPDST